VEMQKRKHHGETAKISCYLTYIPLSPTTTILCLGIESRVHDMMSD